MAQDYTIFQKRADAVQAEIHAACRAAGRNPAEVEQGIGENRVQEAIDKKPQVRTPLRWELIGHLQSNKAKLAAECFDRVQSVDSPKLITRLNRAAGELDRELAILLQVNAGNDPAKFGVDLGDAPALLEHALQQPALRVDGLMTIAPLSGDPDVARRAFANLRELRDQLASDFGVDLPTLSMGMSGDMAAAIAAGSTQVRVGTALFGQREPRR